MLKTVIAVQPFTSVPVTVYVFAPRFVNTPADAWIGTQGVLGEMA